MTGIKNLLCRRYVFLLILIIVASSDSCAAELFIPAENVKPRIKIHDGPIVSLSDSLFFDALRIKRDVDYTIDYINGVIVLNRNVPDSFAFLKIYYKPVPSWLKKHYGNSPLPPTLNMTESADYKRVSDLKAAGKSDSRVSLSGAKRFSVISERRGNSQFNQSLDLTIKGELTPGVEISGSLSDKGYDPAYGSINSRISELDKLNLTVRSKYLMSQIGNLEISQKADYRPPVLKQVSGIETSYNSRTISALATVAQSRGQFKSVSFNGRDKTQGPYRIISDGDIAAIVPGSEKVWLDGYLLERGADKDYVMDYPSGSITFTQNNFIDSRSRIEVDFEPLADNYQRELYRFQSGLATADSTVSFGFAYLHEGDNKDETKTAELTGDDIIYLQGLGDDIENNYRDGAIADTGGAYVERFDLSGNRYFEYVGEGAGEYSVIFTAVNSGEGDYTYVGAGAYEYIGTGNGDYVALKRIPVPSGEDYFEASIGVRPMSNGWTGLTVRHTNYDRNVFSRLDDDDNLGNQYIFSAGYGGETSLFARRSGVDMTIDIIEQNFKSYARRRLPDMEREYMISDSLTSRGREVEVTGNSVIVLPSPYSLIISAGMLDYENQFDSRHGKVSAYASNANSLLPVLSYTRYDAVLDTSGSERNGRGNVYEAEWRYTGHDRLTVRSLLRFDRRTNRYAGYKKGTTEKEIEIELDYKDLRLALQRYEEDTLVTEWRENLLRYRGSLRLSKSILGIKTDLLLTGQRIDGAGTYEDQFMVRTKYSYSSSVKGLSISGDYAMADENRYERGLQYLKVDEGEGKFIYEDGQYIPDANGEYIEIEEVLSEQAEVKKGSKSFNLTYSPGSVYCRMTSSIDEELLAGGERDVFWIIPFLSDDNQSYLYRRKYYAGEVKLIDRPGYYFINLSGSYNYEGRMVGGLNYEKYDWSASLGFQERYGAWDFIQEGIYFEYLRDSYYSSPGNIDGFKISSRLMNELPSGRINFGLSFRRATDDNGSVSRQYIILVRPIFRLLKGGETELKLEAYRQELMAVSVVSYRLTDNLSGRRGVRWSFRSEYNLGRDLKLSVSFNGRHADDRRPRIVGQGELIARF